MLVRKNNSTKVSANFTEAEYFTKSSDFRGDSHNVSDSIIEAFQYLRTFTGVAWKITSTGRTEAHNKSVGGATASKHLIFHPEVVAADGQPSSSSGRAAILKQISDDILNKGAIYNQLVSLGIRGFGLYDSFIHLDSANRAQITVWNMRSDKKKNDGRTTPITAQNEQSIERTETTPFNWNYILIPGVLILVFFGSIKRFFRVK
jgi:hypothetical protein